MPMRSLLADNAIVVFSFDGAVFSIRCDTKVIAFPGEGPRWTVCSNKQAGALRVLGCGTGRRDYGGPPARHKVKPARRFCLRILHRIAFFLVALRRTAPSYP